jgi:DNA-binding TFAR19-related protein (PDSD5 family)
LFSLQCEKSVFSLVFGSEVKQKLNEAKIKRKISEKGLSTILGQFVKKQRKTLRLVF